MAVVGGLVLLAGLADHRAAAVVRAEGRSGAWAWQTRRRWLSGATNGGLLEPLTGSPTGRRSVPGAVGSGCSPTRPTARDLRWTALNTCLGWILMLLLGSDGTRPGSASWCRRPARCRLLVHPGNSLAALVVIGLALIVTGLGLGPAAAPRGRGGCSPSLPARLGEAEPTGAPADLVQTRAETIDSGAAEVRRIERDLHDGAQARLVSLGMSLGAWPNELLAQDPQTAQRLLAEARESTFGALADLRNLVRGIHPPVLAERGLEGAVEALAMVNPVPTTVDFRLPGRLPPPVESAAYFAIAEAVQRDKARRAPRIQITAEFAPGTAVGRLLSIRVSDDGHGGARIGAGTGLRGIERRLSAFDGTLVVDSPADPRP